jgi:plasmid stabilization system protein ParE
MIVRIDEDALAEARALTLRYLRQNPAAGKRFLDLLRRALHDIGAKPTSYPFLESLRRNKRYRRIRLKGYPVFVVYEVIDDEVLVVAVAHGARRPGYWRGRLGR